MRRLIVVLVLAVAVVFTMGAVAQRTPGSAGQPAIAATPAGPHNWITPESSIERAEDAGIRAHTNWVFASANPQVVQAGAQGVGSDVTITQHYETPKSMGCLYKMPNVTAGPCIPSFVAGTGGPQTGGSNVIVIVDAFDNPYAAAELATFNAFWGLPAASFTQVYANGNGACSVPPFNAGWGLEESLDIEWAHVMAPKAAIYLVEACDNSLTNLLYAESVAGSIAASFKGGQITNSWGSGEFSGETAYDPYFGILYWNHISYFVSAGDNGCGAAYPSSAPFVVSAGGTTINRNATTLAFTSESCWAGSGGGSSAQETWSDTWTAGSNTGPWADYQYPIFGKRSRMTPDMSFNADPKSGVVVYDCAYYSGTCYYLVVGGTSVSSPALAGIVNNAGNKLGTGFVYYTAEENNYLYSQLLTARGYKANFYDVKTGSNGCGTAVGWDYCTGVGSPRGLLDK